HQCVPQRRLIIPRIDVASLVGELTPCAVDERQHTANRRDVVLGGAAARTEHLEALDQPALLPSVSGHGARQRSGHRQAVLRLLNPPGRSAEGCWVGGGV